MGEKITILGVKLTCDLQGMDENFNTKYEAIEKMIKHWSYRTLNLQGRISIVKSLALSKIGHIAIVLPNLDNQKANKLEKLTLDFIWKKISDFTKKPGQIRMEKNRAKIKPANGGLGITDISQHWKAGKTGLLRKQLLMEYNEPKEKTQNQNHAGDKNTNQDGDLNTQKRETTEVWLKCQ